MVRKYFKNLGLSRLSIALIYGWFGILKPFGLSPANELVFALKELLLPFLSDDLFLVLLGVGEVAIAIIFLLPQFTKEATTAFAIHMFAAALPLFLLTQMTWQQFLIPTLEGQYILKNILLIALVANVYNDWSRETG